MKRFTEALLLVLINRPAAPGLADEPAVAFAPEEGKLHVLIGGKRFATYVLRDAQVLRPYFTAVHAPNGGQVTRKPSPGRGPGRDRHCPNLGE
jgi:hypothetical protein